MLLVPIVLAVATVGIAVYSHSKLSQPVLQQAGSSEIKPIPTKKPTKPQTKSSNVSSKKNIKLVPIKQPVIPEVPVDKKPIPLSQRTVEYHLDTKLNVGAQQIEGVEIVTWHNPGKKTVSEIYFHLYPNAFSSDKTTFMKESGGALRSDKMTAGSYGSMTITSIKSVDGMNLLPRMQITQPDDGNTNDKTVMKLRLPDPVAPKGDITLQISFTVKLPHAFARMGYAKEFVMAGQWFPKIAAYETVGTRGRTVEGWNIHQYHGNSEFYSDFSIYSVKIQVPTGYTVAATGFPTKPAHQQDKTTTYQFYADDVHDFAWAASPNFVYAEEAFSTANVPGVKIKLYLDPQHKDLKDRYFHAAKSALANYSKWYGAYPYSTLSIVVPPADGGGAGGMEYPTLVTAFAADSEDPDYELERVVVHEIAHQYWYGMVATNEFEEAWLDEGFASYSEDKLMEQEYGVEPNLPLESSYMTSPAPLKLYAWKYNNHHHYAENVYTRAKLVLLGIEKEIGTKQMSKVIRTYFQKWKFKHPSTSDFQKVLEQTTQRSWSEFFDQYVYGSMMADFAVENIQSKSVKENGQKVYEHHVIIRKKGANVSSVPIVFHFANGTTLKKTWDGSEPTMEYKLTHASALSWVAIDPLNTIVLENRHMNNFMRAEVEPRSNIRWNLGVVKFIETLLSSVAW